MAETPQTPQVSPIRGVPSATPPQGGTGAHGLGPHVVGQRVVVRRVLPGETGPSGGPAMTDVLGECVSWGGGLCLVRTADGTTVSILVSDIVSGKPVPPRPSVRLRATPREVHLHATGAWPGAAAEEMGDWLLRAAGLVPDAQHPEGRLVKRANSALAIGEPGVPLPEAAERVRGFYAARQQPAYAQVVADDEVDRALGELGWSLGPGGDVLVQVAPTSRAVRGLGRAGADVELVEDSPHRARARLDDRAVAQAHVDGDWVLVRDLWVAPDHRRAGLARQVLAEVLDWAAARGATTAHLQVEADNAPALQLYASAGFATHHAYRYRTAPDQ